MEQKDYWGKTTNTGYSDKLMCETTKHTMPGRKKTSYQKRKNIIVGVVMIS